jgi:hypothetical protein
MPLTAPARTHGDDRQPFPLDNHNRKTIRQCHPPGWTNRKGSDYDLADWRRDLEGERMSTRAADDFEFIRSRMEQLKRERQPAPAQPTPTLPPAGESDERVWNWDGFRSGFLCRM